MRSRGVFLGASFHRQGGGEVQRAARHVVYNLPPTHTFPADFVKKDYKRARSDVILYPSLLLPTKSGPFTLVRPHDAYDDNFFLEFLAERAVVCGLCVMRCTKKRVKGRACYDR